MNTLRNAVLGACLALPLAAATGHAQSIEQHGRTIQVPPGAVVVILPGPVATPGVTATAAPAALPVLQMIAQQQAEMQHMMAQMNALLPPMPPMPNPSQLFRAAFGAGGPMLTLAGRPGVCSQSITIVQHGNSAPVITRSQSGCGAAPAGEPANVRDLPPVTAPAQAPRLIQANDAPHALTLIAER